MQFTNEGVSLLPRAGFLAKNQTLSFTPTPVFLPDLRRFTGDFADEAWCPVRCSKFYLARTKPLRGDVDQLFVSTSKPHNAVSRPTLSRWLVSIIRSAYFSLGRTLPGVRAHDTRALAASWALYAGVPLKDILANVGWQCNTTFQSAYLKDVPFGMDRRAWSAIAALRVGASSS